MPEPKGNIVLTHCFVDADLAGNTVTRQSQTGILILCNRSPIIRHSKIQNIVKTGTFGTEFTAMNKYVELSEAL